MGATTDAGESSGAGFGSSTTTAVPFTPTSGETLIERTVSKYLSSIVDDPSVELGRIRDALLQRINAEISLENKARKDAYSTSPVITKYQVLDELTVVRVLLARRCIVAISLSGSRSADDTLLAMYCDMGPEEGLYAVSDAPIAQLASEVRPSLTANALESLLKRLRIHAPVVSRTTDAHLIPVNNGVFNHDTQTLMPFSPDWVFLTKSPVNYVPDAPLPILTHPDDGTTWDVESWVTELSDDPGVPELLWEILSAIVRPGVRWNKAAFFHSTRGNNGKGTLCGLGRNLVGRAGWASVPIANFGKPFALTELLHARAIITDENSVGAFARDLGDFKSVVTGDTFTLERKFKDPVSVSFSGMVVQCVNDFPKSRDKSASYTRRQLFVPFKKWFGGSERMYIKSDYLGRADVLEYVLYRVLSMTHTQFSNPAACQDLLSQFQRENNPVRDFWMEFEDDFVWELLPTAFLYDLFVAWFRKTHPAGVPLNRNDFASNLVEVLSGDGRWLYTDPQKKHRPGQRMAQPEPLIARYDLKDWMDPNYSGVDPLKKSVPSPLRTNYIGVLRIPVVAGNAPGTPGAGGPSLAQTAREDKTSKTELEEEVGA